MTCVCDATKVRIKAGDMAVLTCPLSSPQNSTRATVKWTSHALNLTSNTPLAQQKQMGVLAHKGNLVILSVSGRHQGNYSCSVRNVTRRFWQLLTGATQPRHGSQTCHATEKCDLYCPSFEVQLPGVIPGDIFWEELKGQKKKYFTEVTESDSGLYNCTRTFRYPGQAGQIYNKTFTIKLDILPNYLNGKTPAITSPQTNDTVYVDLGSTAVIDCKAVTYNPEPGSAFLFWLIGKSILTDNDSLPIYYNSSSSGDTKRVQEIRMKSSLVIRRVSEEDLSKEYICKLELLTDDSSFVTIRLRQTPVPPSASYLHLALSIVCPGLLVAALALICVKFKVEIALFFRDALGCDKSKPDGKNHDAFVMCYQADAALSERERRQIVSVLEEKFGYSLCLDDRDVSPGRAVAEAVLELVGQSRTVLLVPTSSEPCLGSGLLCAIHEALVERQTRLVFIKAEAAEAPSSGSLPETVELLCEAGRCVTWRGTSSMSTSSSFWKQLRYYLPARRKVATVMSL